MPNTRRLGLSLKKIMFAPTPERPGISSTAVEEHSLNRGAEVVLALMCSGKNKKKSPWHRPEVPVTGEVEAVGPLKPPRVQDQPGKHCLKQKLNLKATPGLGNIAHQ